MGGYSYNGSGKAEYFYTVLIIFHIFIANILLLNYMIAILSQSYVDMLDLGSFMYKCSLYEYCEKYMIADTEDCYGEMVRHAAPMNGLVVLMMPFIPSRTAMKWIANKYSLMVFWLENFFGVFFFLIFELILIPLVYIKTIFNVMYSTSGLFTTVFNVMTWITFGIFYLIIIMIRDVYYLLFILYMHNGCKAYKEEQDKLRKKRESFDDDGLVDE